MISLLSLLADVAAVTAPTPPELELMTPAAILGDALGEQITLAQRATLTRAVEGCVTDKPELLAEAVRQGLPTEISVADRYLNGFGELLSLRGLISAGTNAGGQIDLRAPSTFSALRRLSLLPATSHAPVILVGGLVDGDELNLGHLPGSHPFFKDIRLVFDQADAGPLLTTSIGSGGFHVDWQSQRERWRQPAGEIGRIKLSWRTRSCTIVTELQDEPFLIVGAQLSIRVIPVKGVQLYATKVLTEQNRPLIVYLRTAVPVTSAV